MRVKIREVTKKLEIIKAFSHLYTDRSKVLLWQTSRLDRTKKTLIYCELVSIDNKNIYLTPYSTTIKDILSKTIKTTNKIFIRGSYNGVLFKSDNFFIRGDRLEVPIPTKILLSENRRKKRHILNNKHAYIKFKNNSLLSMHNRASHRIQDFGENGISIFMTKNDSHHYEVNESYKVLSIAGINLPPNFEAKLVYQKVHTYIKHSKTQVIFKAGFKFNKSLPTRLFNHLLDIVNSKDKAG